MHLLHHKQAVASPIAEDVRAGLSADPKSLPPKLFYDRAGSELFEQITQLPEYYLTRTEQSIFDAQADDILEAAGGGLTVIELGAGTAAKTRTILKSLLRRQLSVRFYPIDVSPAALAIAQTNLSDLTPALRIFPLVGDYSQGVARLKDARDRKLVLFIGSSIGNYEPAEAAQLLQRIRESLHTGDALLLGTDMVKDPDVLRRAYNDSAGVTARFNLNLLQRINRDLGGEFDLQTFRHEAIWNARKQRIEMYLESLKEQSVFIGELGKAFHFRKGERIHTENSYKFTRPRLARILSKGDFELERSWEDQKGWFGVHLARIA